MRAYLSRRQHFEDVVNVPAQWIAFANRPNARSGLATRRDRSRDAAFKAMVSVLERSLVQNSRRRRATAQSIAALSIGGMIVARTMVDRALADELRAACIAVALDLGGWNKKSKSESGKLSSPNCAAGPHPSGSQCANG